MVKTVTAAENAINKLQLNTVSIEVNAASGDMDERTARVSQYFMHRVWAAIFGSS